MNFTQMFGFHCIRNQLSVVTVFETDCSVISPPYYHMQQKVGKWLECKTLWSERMRYHKVVKCMVLLCFQQPGLAGSTDCHASMTFQCSWSRLLFLGFVFCTFSAFSSPQSIELFQCIVLHVPDLWCGQSSLSANSTTNVGLAHTRQVIASVLCHSYSDCCLQHDGKVLCGWQAIQVDQAHDMFHFYHHTYLRLHTHISPDKGGHTQVASGWIE